ncbi:soluble calcium-activated nucleotidase 1-like [Ruditapes philippinarum]|uniref:soluble calcium-activated nucleotidase 1-like n=1 Tax=Ruditapes philippinarum TaxID=129788 RepID=UPI00295ADC08|nr:soluble calcium-activated nucleotidase 1-like [Ruditapes philippinarum]
MLIKILHKMSTLHKSQSYCAPRSSTNGNQFSVNDWMQAIRTPTPYRVGNAKLHVKPRMLAYAAIIFTAVFILFIYFIPSRSSRFSLNCNNDFIGQKFVNNVMFDSTYPFTSPIKTTLGTQYRIALVTDLDTDSKSTENKNTWKSHLKYGNLTINDNYSKVMINFDKTVTLTSKVSEGGRGMELSELIVFNGRLYTVDDRTGIVYEIIGSRVVPWVILSDGNGKEPKGFKCEWATVKDGRLYIGGLGKEWTTGDGQVQNTNPQWVKSIGPHGDVMHHDWKENYNALRAKMNMNLPGYMIHEACVWSSIHQRWFFLPRRASTERYDEVADEKRATNLMLTASDDFSKIEVSTVGKLNPTHGFSSFKFIPGSNNNIIVALKSEEDGDKKATYILVFDIEGHVIYSEKKVGDMKFEGIEFV